MTQAILYKCMDHKHLPFAPFLPRRSLITLPNSDTRKLDKKLASRECRGVFDVFSWSDARNLKK